MKIEQKKVIRIGALIISICLIIISVIWINELSKNKEKMFSNKNIDEVAYAPSKSTIILEYLQKEVENNFVYDNMTMEELTNKLNRSLKSTLTGTGKQFATKSLELGIDPYLAVSIVLHETGCKWNCSKIVRNCNNVGGVKGKPGCNGGPYKAYPTLEEGINAYLINLQKNYISKGLITVEQINTRYASSKAWAPKINSYINEIKTS